MSDNQNVISLSLLLVFFLEGEDEKFTGTDNFFSATSTQTISFLGNCFANNFFFYEMQCFIMRSFMLLH